MSMNLNNRYVEKILTEFLKNEMHRIGIKKAVIGLSGGIDSAVTTFLAARSLGNQNVTCLIMPYETSSEDSVSDSLEVVKLLQVNHKLIDITNIAKSFQTAIDDSKSSRVRNGNILARIRMILLYDESAKQNALVVGTGNKTEILLGYSTVFGDAACGINPVGDLYKTQIRSLAAHLGVPKKIIDKKPSADLWKGQTDEDDLGFSYEQIDDYLFKKIDERMSDEKLIAEGFKEDFMKKINSMIIRSQFKRVPPLIAKLANRTVNIDFRYNRDWNT